MSMAEVAIGVFARSSLNPKTENNKYESEWHSTSSATPKLLWSRRILLFFFVVFLSGI